MSLLTSMLLILLLTPQLQKLQDRALQSCCYDERIRIDRIRPSFHLAHSTVLGFFFGSSLLLSTYNQLLKLLQLF